MSIRFNRSLAACSFGLFLFAFPAPARAFDWGVKLETGLATPLGTPQAELFNPGLGASLKGLIGLGRYVDVQAGLTFIGLAARPGAPSSDLGVGWGYGAGLRLKLPRDAKSGISPWIDGDLMYVRTGPLDRFGLSFGAGVAFALDEERRWWLGPFVRYLQIVQPDNAGTDNTDAKILIVGVSLEFGSPHHFAAAPLQCAPCVSDSARTTSDRDGDGIPDDLDKCPDQAGPKSTNGCPDRDGDGLADIIDLCPDVPGPIENRGCPYYKKVVIKGNKLELTEKIRFAWNKDAIEPESWPLLDEVVRALRDNKSFHVLIEGHADSSGTDEHNQTLSEGRARSVLAYLVQHGVAANRLDAQGFSSSQPLQTNQTVNGREANRRVEFMIDLKLINDRSTK